MHNDSNVPNWINGRPDYPSNRRWIPKFDPHLGVQLSSVADSDACDVSDAVSVAARAFVAWSERTPVNRGEILRSLVGVMRRRADELASCVGLETGKPPSEAQGEVHGAIAQGEYWAGEGMRLHGRSLNSGIAGKYSHTIRQPIGVAGLIVPSNTPIANVAWKVFPALLCGNAVVVKAAEDAPRTAFLFAELTKEAGVPDGIVNVIQGRGDVAGAALVQHEQVGVISFTGSTSVGRWIAQVGGRRLARVSLELGGKNPFVICDDADIDHALHWAVLSGFSNAGQRCAAASRLLVFDGVYDEVRDGLVSRALKLKLGTSAGCDIGPVISARQKTRILDIIERARESGGKILCGGKSPAAPSFANGFYIEPTVIESLDGDSEASRVEIFGPVVTLHRVSDIHAALRLANSTEYGLTAAIHTKSIDRAMWFAQRVRSGVANVNCGTYGSEPHMPFGGFGASGNGSREPGLEAIEVYSELKNISFLVRQGLV